jgi:hypothetical protein
VKEIPHFVDTGTKRETDKIDIWWRRCMKIRCEYEEAGTASAFYMAKGSEYRNPQEKDVRSVLRKRLKHEEIDNVLDLACGSGEVTLEVELMGGKTTMFDPYCFEAAKQREEEIAKFDISTYWRLVGSALCCGVVLFRKPL